MSSLTIVLGAGFSQSLGIPGTQRITELVDENLTVRHGESYTALRDRLKGRFGDKYNFEVLAAALETCEQFGKPYILAPPYRSVLPEVTNLRDGLTLEVARDMYEVLMGRVLSEVSVDWTKTIAPDRRGQIEKCFSAIEKPHEAVEIGTLNYDFGAEAFHDGYVDGFTGEGERQYFDAATFLDKGAKTRIGHVHGCIAYGIEEAPKKFVKLTGPLEPRKVQLWTPREDGSFWSGVITGTDKPGKIAMPPYSVYFAWLADQLLRSSRLMIIGYGIGDYHLNVWLTTALRFHAKQNLRCVIVDHFDPASGEFPASVDLFAYAIGNESPFSPEEKKAIEFKDGMAKSGGAILIHTGFPFKDGQFEEVAHFLES